MIDVYIHKNFENEKKYVLNFIFGELLNLDYNIKYHEKINYFICFDDKKIEINNSFFSISNLTDDYYKNKLNLPLKPLFLENNHFTSEQDIPIIFGDEKFNLTDDYAYIGNDLIAGIFFMLSLWEEIALQDYKDEHGRFDEKHGYLKKNNLHHRPLVNEYTEFLWNIMSALNCKSIRKKRKYNVFLTHDVDDFAKYDTVFKYIKTMGGDIIKRKSVKSFLKTNQNYFNHKIRSQKDIYNTFEHLINLSEKQGYKSRFYFMPGKMGEKDVKFDIDNPKVIETINYIIDRGHIIGIHPSYNAYNDVDTFGNELERLKRITPNIKEGRQHFLRFENPLTWQIWDKFGLSTDSTIGYNGDIGFRAGVCCEYPVFDLYNKKTLNLRERPLLIMDTAIRNITNGKTKAFEKSKNIINLTKKYHGDFVILWHNSNLAINEWEGWSEVYKGIILEL